MGLATLTLYFGGVAVEHILEIALLGHAVDYAQDGVVELALDLYERLLRLTQLHLVEAVIVFEAWQLGARQLVVDGAQFRLLEHVAALPRILLFHLQFYMVHVVFLVGAQRPMLASKLL